MMKYRRCPLCYGDGTRANPWNKAHPSAWPRQPFRVTCSCCEGEKVIVVTDEWRPTDVYDERVENGPTVGDVMRVLAARCLPQHPAPT